MGEVGEMALAAIDKRSYARLLARVLPQTITTDDENERMIADMEKLDTRGRPLTPEEERLTLLMGLLIRQFEESRYSLGHAEPLAGIARSDGVARAAAARPAASVWVP